MEVVLYFMLFKGNHFMMCICIEVLLVHYSATLTHPEISYSVNKACQFMHILKHTHWQLVKRILRSLKGVLYHGLSLKKSDNMSLVGFADADEASDPDDRKSTSGFCVYFGNNLVSWGSKKQSIISRSSTEA
ncbi:uncharacterized mitochondrial protein AtMg00810-like [Cucumis melo]|uniref:Uncharacterized mitochondrial protein AtMg00810-like n=1 Tax=Cucumis melo TaxID=3656 RepID=A0ABM3KNI5_CUCME|nr:uncharacterized mitochondrial protein AtMg00810-like [Cucumis melo]